jgi:hypothetical protein
MHACQEERNCNNNMAMESRAKHYYMYCEQESKAVGEEDNPTDSNRNPKPPVFARVPLFVCGCARVRVTLFAGEQEKK